MKKVYAICGLVLIVCLNVGILDGCKREKTIMDDFDSETNQQESIAGYSYEVPKEWEKGDNSVDDIIYYYSGNDMLMVMYSEMDGSLSDENTREAFIKGVASTLEKFKLVEESKTEVNGDTAYKYDMNIKLAGKDYATDMVFFESANGVIGFMMATSQTSENDYSEDFDKIIDSIHKPLPFINTIDDVNDMISVLQVSDEFDFRTDGVKDIDDGSTMESLVDIINGTNVTILGDENENVTSVHVSTENEEYFNSVCTMVLFGLQVLSEDTTEVMDALATENLVEMSDFQVESDDMIVYDIDGVSYNIYKYGDEYTFVVSRDFETKEEYEDYVKENNLE